MHGSMKNLIALKNPFLRVYFESCIMNKFSNFVSEIEESVKHETTNFEDNINCLSLDKKSKKGIECNKLTR